VHKSAHRAQEAPVTTMTTSLRSMLLLLCTGTALGQAPAAVEPCPVGGAR